MADSTRDGRAEDAVAGGCAGRETTNAVSAAVDADKAVETGTDDLSALAQIEQSLWNLLDLAEAEWRASDEPCDLKSALVRAVLAAGWRPPLPPAPRKQIGWNIDAYGKRTPLYEPQPDDEPIGVEPSSPLPDSETEWGCRDYRSQVHSVGVENETQARAMLSMTPVRREVGPWIEVPRG